ncbi:MAG: xylose isomerase, partial [Ferruginibacter sp.]
MQRKKFMQQALLASGALFLPVAGTIARGTRANQLRDEKPFNLDYGIHDGMFKNHAGPDFVEQIKF